MSERSKRARRRGDMRRHLAELPAIEQVGPHLWNVQWPGRARFQCSTAALQSVLTQLSPSERSIVFERALGVARKTRVGVRS